MSRTLHQRDLFRVNPLAQIVSSLNYILRAQRNGTNRETMDNWNNYIEESLTRCSFKLYQIKVIYLKNSNLGEISKLEISFQVSECEELQKLAGKFKFQIWEMNHRDDFIRGLFVFEKFMDCYTFFMETEQLPYLQWRSSWFKEGNRYKNNFSLIENMTNQLNADCIDHIAKHLDPVTFCDLLRVVQNPILSQTAVQMFFNLVIDRSTVGAKFDMLDFYYILQSVGQHVINITVSLRTFQIGWRERWATKLKYAIIHTICYLCLNVRSITLEHFGNFGLENINREVQAVLDILRQRNVIINHSN